MEENRSKVKRSSISYSWKKVDEKKGNYKKCPSYLGNERSWDYSRLFHQSKFRQKLLSHTIYTMKWEFYGKTII